MEYKSAIQILKASKERNHSMSPITITSIPTSHTRAGKVVVSTSGKSVPVVNPIKKAK